MPSLFFFIYNTFNIHRNISTKKTTKTQKKCKGFNRLPFCKAKLRRLLSFFKMLRWVWHFSKHFVTQPPISGIHPAVFQRSIREKSRIMLLLLMIDRVSRPIQNLGGQKRPGSLVCLVSFSSSRFWTTKSGTFVSRSSTGRTSNFHDHPLQKKSTSRGSFFWSYIAPSTRPHRVFRCFSYWANIPKKHTLNKQRFKG